MSSEIEPGFGKKLVGLARGLTSPPPARQESNKRLAAPWLVVIDPQVIFADPASPWGAPAFDEAMAVIEALAPRFGERVIVTRFVPGKVHVGSWRAYFKHWDFADLPATDPMYQLVPAAAHLSTLSSVDMPTFSKWGNALRGLIGPTPRLVLAGCATDCCVISTALAAADSGATVRVISDACAGSSDENHAAALKVMALYAPQIKVLTASQL